MNPIHVSKEQLRSMSDEQFAAYRLRLRSYLRRVIADHQMQNQFDAVVAHYVQRRR